ncbi:MAG: ribosome biogenesis GTP-binding protein YihA/YsxC [Clostridia bacterium]|nr:ribosome biogenesis GTP-binding protein YihA/YsxC [Clostridia bacterium]
MIIKNPKYELTAVKPEQYPVSIMPEIAFVGRSNVGKSSIINTLLNRKNLARVSATPGKTREINFYNIDDVLYFVDLPGYGYASVSKEKKATWSGVIETYLTTRQQLKLIVLLVDIRHTPSADDKQMYEWLVASGFNHFIVATKADKISRSQIITRIRDIRGFLRVDDAVKVIPYSSETRQGKEDIWGNIETVI